MKRLDAALLVLVLLVLASPAAAQQAVSYEPPYDHPLFTGPVHTSHPAAFDQQHLALALQLDFDARSIAGDATLRLVRLDASADTLVLHAAGLAVDSVWVGPITSALAPAGWRTGLGDTLAIGLDSLAADTFNVRVRYRATPQTGLYFVDDGEVRQAWTQGEPEDTRHWIPLIDAPDDPLTSELRVTVPQPMRVLSNGRLLDASADEDRITYHWSQLRPHAPYLIMLAAGHYEPVQETAVAPSGDPIPLAYWVYPEATDRVEATFGRTPAMLRFYADRLGVPYPWDKYDQVVLRDFQFGGMENTSATTLTDRVLIDERAALDYDPDGLIAHELVHQWFGDLVTCASWTHIWLNEGFATYGSALFTEHDAGPEAFAATMQRLADAYFAEAERYRRPLVWDRWTDPIQLFDAHSYRKGAWVLHMLRTELGDELFFEVLQRYLTEHAFGPVETADFRRVLEAMADRRFDAFFDQWIYGAGHPELAVRYAYVDSTATLRLTVEQTQEGFRVPEVFEADLPLVIGTLGGAEPYAVALDARRQTFEVPLDEPPRYVALDPNGTLLAQLAVEQPIQAWVAQLREADAVGARVAAARALQTFADDPALLVGLRLALADEASARVRAALVETLNAIPPAPAVERVLLERLDDPEARVREAALEALGQYPHSPAVAEAAFDRAQNDLSYAVQAEAVRTLARISAPSARDVARSALVTPSFRETIRQAAFDAFAVLDLPAGEKLGYGLEYSTPMQPSEVRAAALRLLGTLAGDEPQALERLTEALDAPAYRVRQAAIAALAQVDTEAARAALTDHLPEEPQARLRDQMRAALAAPPAAAD